MAWYEANSFHINNLDGNVESGGITDTYTDNAARHVLDEVTGAPGFDYEYWFETIPGTVSHFRVKFNGYYDGSPTHVVDVQAWNYLTSAWNAIFTLLDASVDATSYSADLPSNIYSSIGQAKVRFYHVSSGNTSHDLYVDQLVLEDRSSLYSTAPPTTVPLTTTTPTTVVPTTVPPTSVPTTLDEFIAVSPIELILSQYFVYSQTSAVLPNEGLNQEADWGPIEITLSVHGSNGNTGILVDPVNIVVTPVFSGYVVGKVIEVDPGIEIVILPRFSDILIAIEKCNFLKWSKIGELDFTIDESNLAGERPLDWKGCIWHIAKLGDKVVAYGENGVTILKPSGVHFGMDTIYRIGLKNKGAFVGSESEHFFVDNLGQLYRLTDKFEKLDYSEFLSTMGTIILSLDIEKRLVYICDGTNGYVYGIDSKSFGKGPANITGFGAQSNGIYVVSYNPIVTPKFEICTDIYDFGTRNAKTIREVEVGTNVSQFLYASIDYRNSYKDEFKQIGWFLVNPDGRAFPKCYGSEFRFRLKSSIYEYLELDYIKVKGHIHAWLGFTYQGSDLSSRTGDN